MSIRTLGVLAFAGQLFAASAVSAQTVCTEVNTTIAKVAAIDQAWVWNRFGAVQPHGMMYALVHDLWVLDRRSGLARPPLPGESLSPGHVILKEGKRPRPLTLRVNKGSCLQVAFINLLDSNRRDHFKVDVPEPGQCRAGTPKDRLNPVWLTGCGEQPSDRMAGFHINGLSLAKSIADDASHVGTNASSMVAPGGSKTYTYVADNEGPHFVYSPAAITGGDGNGGSIFAGLFGAVNVEPAGSVWYRSQLTRKEMEAATVGSTRTGHPLLDYSKLTILQGQEIRHGDLNAIIDTRKSPLPDELRCLDKDGNPFPVCGDRRQPFREFTAIFHDESGAVQAFKEFEPNCTGDGDTSPTCSASKVLADVLHSVRDGFAINYGTAGAGAEVLANRKGVGPVRDCPECFTEEFFLSSWAVGDPSMVVDIPANLQQKGAAFEGQRASKVFFPDDPSNVYRSYLNDRVVIRNLHAGPKEHHVFHLHAHQWLQAPQNPRSSYLDSQTIGPGGAYSYEISYGGSGNRNKTVGDSIFHCHFYPHFAQGMWALWRVHDVFEAGTPLDEKGIPLPRSRAQPDGELLAGSPIPGLVPLPGSALAPVPGQVQILAGQVDLIDKDKNPGYPFFVPALAGHRPPTPPMDIAIDAVTGKPQDGGLHRHVVKSGVVTPDPLPYSLVKHWNKLEPKYLTEEGEPVEKVAMAFHAQSTHVTVNTDGNPALFATNGRKPVAGAPYAEPCEGPAADEPRVFQAGVIQLDLIINKKGWHTPQARILSLRDDILATQSGDRLPQPMFIRAHSGDCIRFEHTNLTPAVYEKDAYQIKTPTDIIGQHIHLVKFDVLASDGGSNGFNYEDGTPSPEDVQHRIKAIRNQNGCAAGAGPSADCPVAQPHPWFPLKKEWEGGQVTVQRWYADPQMMKTTDGQVIDKTLDTVFTHDHFGASTHQQAGLYAGLIVEPVGTRWFDQDAGGAVAELGRGRRDGGPTSWKSVVVSNQNPEHNFREFALEYQDFHMAFEKDSTTKALNAPKQVADEPLPKLVKWDSRCQVGDQCPEAVSSKDTGVMSINYRSEPLSARVLNAAGSGQAAGVQGDLAYMFSSIPRADASLNNSISSYSLVGGTAKPAWPLPSPGMRPNDPFTPLLETYEQERIKIRLLAGAHEHEHSFGLHGLAWKYMSKEPNSGYRNFLATALSEHHEIDGLIRIPSALAGGERPPRVKSIDHLYKIGASIEDLWYGNWGLLRAYKDGSGVAHLQPVSAVAALAERNERGFADVAKLADGRIGAILNRAREDIFGRYRPVNAEELRGFIAAASQLEQLLVRDAMRLRVPLSIGPLPAAPQLAGVAKLGAPSASAAVEQPTALLARAAGVEAFRVSSGLLAPGLASVIAEDQSTALLEAEFEDTIETLQVLRARAAALIDAAAKEAAQPATNRREPLSDLRTFALSGGGLESLRKQFADLRQRLPHLINFADPQSVPVCDPDSAQRGFWVVAVDAKTALRDGTLIYHRFPPGTKFRANKLVEETWKHVHDPSALLYVRRSDLDAQGKYRANRKIEPLILRASAGECIVTALTNGVKQFTDAPGYSTLPNLKDGFNLNDLAVPREVGLHAQLVRKHLAADDGFNVGINPAQTVAPGATRFYSWYAGVIETNAANLPKFTPVEFGAVNLMPADPLKQAAKGLIGALVIEPKGASWAYAWAPAEPFSGSSAPLRTRASATVFHAGDRNGFRDYVLVGQNDANFRLAGSQRTVSRFETLPVLERIEVLRDLPRFVPTPLLPPGLVPPRPLPHGAGLPSLPIATPTVLAPPVMAALNRAFDRPVRRVSMCDPGAPVFPSAAPNYCAISNEEADAVETGHKAFNYRSEAMWMRRVHGAEISLPKALELIQHDQLSDGFKGRNAPNQTPRFCAKPGDDVRLRVVFPNGHGRNHVLHVHGHSWQELPWQNDSTVMGANPMSNTRTSQDGVGAGSYWNLLLNSGQGGAGGSNKVPGDYLIRDQYSWGFDNGLWSVLRVAEQCF